jgi:hypothetical protein
LVKSVSSRSALRRAHVGVVAGDVRDRHQLEQLLDDLPFVLRPPGGNGRRLCCHCCAERGSQNAGESSS